MLNSHKKPTLEVLLYCLSAVAAFCLRFIRLGHLPLNDFEAANALQALNLANHQNVLVGGQPGFILPTAGLFSIFGAGEFFARFFPALAGMVFVLLPLLFKKYLGKETALLLSFFFTFEPALIEYSRTADGTMLAVLFLLAGLGFLINHRSILSGVFLGAALTCGHSTWLGLTGILLAVGVYLLLNPIQRIDKSEVFPQMSRSEVINFGISFVACVFLLSTGFMTIPNGLSGIGNGFVDFLQSFKLQSLLSARTTLWIFICTEFPAVLLGLWSLIRGILKKDSIRIFLALWFVIAAILAIVRPGREMMDWVWAIVPLWALAGSGLYEWIKSGIKTDKLVTLIQLGLTLFLVIFSYLNLLSLLFNTYGDQQVIKTRLIGTLLPLALLIMISLLISWGWSTSASKRGLLLAFVGLLGFLNVSNSIKSAGAQNQASADLWRPGATVTGGQLMKSQIESISLWNHGERKLLDIQVVNEDLPSMRWLLRDFSATTFDTQYSPSLSPSAIIAPDYMEIGSESIYRGQALTWQEYPSYATLKARDWVKWMIYRQIPVEENRVILWARNDLFR